MKIVRVYDTNCPNCYSAGKLKAIWRLGKFSCDKCGLRALGVVHDGWPEELADNEMVIRPEKDGDADA